MLWLLMLLSLFDTVDRSVLDCALRRLNVEPSRVGAGFKVLALEWWHWLSSLLVELTSATLH